MFKFGQASLSRLAGCDETIVKLMKEAIKTSPIDFTIVSGHRGKQEQNKLVDDGFSKLRYPKSKHNRYPSCAVDIAPYVNGKLVWDSEDESYDILQKHIKDTADKLGILVNWGWDMWNWDKPHWELQE